MHELSIALSLVEMAEEQTRKQGGSQVFSVHLKLGLLSGVVKDALLFAFEAASVGTLVEGATLMIEELPVVVFCPNCQQEQTPCELFQFFCPVCATPTPEIRSGKELTLVGLEIA
ncbi:MAG: hydrogenase maturation nickel metallochaperone HypA [Blastocatellia bacterium]|nr:hydrogenase maturation nickel metallochaperone HypA [Blastocatellia bacterium]